MKTNELNNLLIKWGIVGKFSEKEICNTGAVLSDINTDSFELLCKLRALIESPIYLICNGMTTGNHKSPGHKLGNAFDVRIPRKPSYTVFKFALDSGFNKLGIYWNGGTYSYHLEKAEKCSFWSANKLAPGKGKWDFKPLINNPAK